MQPHTTDPILGSRVRAPLTLAVWTLASAVAVLVGAAFGGDGLGGDGQDHLETAATGRSTLARSRETLPAKDPLLTDDCAGPPAADRPAAVGQPGGALPAAADEPVRRFIELHGDIPATATRRQRVAAHHEMQRRFLSLQLPEIRRVLYRYDRSPCLFVELSSAEAAKRIERIPAVRALHEDRACRPGMFRGRRLIGAHHLHEMDILGTGSVAVVIDTGIDAAHPDFEGAVLHEYHFLEQGDDVGPGAEDHHGHGTHVSGILAARGALAIGTGVAPGAQLVVLRTLGEGGGHRSDWVAAVEHALRLHEDESENGIHIDAMNMSIESLALHRSPCDDDNPAIAAALDAARDAGISLIGCSGNHGSRTELSVPGCLESTISVAATSRYDIHDIVESSNRDETLDFIAPGKDIVSDAPGGGWERMSGCSMAVPFVTGTVCLMRAVDPALTPDEIQILLERTAEPVFDEETELTFGALNAQGAVLAARSRDCNGNGERDWFDIHQHLTSLDCNGNEVPDECDIALGTSSDDNGNAIPDECSEDNPFHRGDANVDSAIDITDVLVLLTRLFGGGRELQCLDAADVTNDGTIDISDPVFVLNYLYVGGAAPPEPGPPGGPCGFDTEDFGAEGNLGCHGYARCQ